MAEEFSALESELMDAAKAGNVDHVVGLLRDVGNLYHLWKPNAAQATAIDRAAERCLRKSSGNHTQDIPVEDLQAPASSERAVTSAAGRPAERLLKGYMVSSVNEWGADQTRILLVTDEAVHRVKYNFNSDSVVSWNSTKLDNILRVEYGNFKAAQNSFTTYFWKREIEDQQGFRIYTTTRDGKKSINEVLKEEFAASQAQQDNDGVMKNQEGEYFREYRALLAEDEPWKEEVFMLELVAALQAVKILTNSNFDIRLTKMEKSIPGGIFTVLHNANRRRQHGL